MSLAVAKAVATEAATVAAVAAMRSVLGKFLPKDPPSRALAPMVPIASRPSRRAPRRPVVRATRRAARRPPERERGAGRATLVPSARPKGWRRRTDASHYENGSARLGVFGTKNQYGDLLDGVPYFVHPKFFGPRMAALCQMWDKWRLVSLEFEFQLSASAMDPYTIVAAVDVNAADTLTSTGERMVQSLTSWQHSKTMMSNQVGYHSLKYRPLRQPTQGYFTNSWRATTVADLNSVYAGRLWLIQAVAPTDPRYVTVIVHYTVEFDEAQCENPAASSVVEAYAACPPATYVFDSLTAAQRAAMIAGAPGASWISSAGHYQLRLGPGTYHFISMATPADAPAGAYGFGDETWSSISELATRTTITDSKLTSLADKTAVHISEFYVPEGAYTAVAPTFTGGGDVGVTSNEIHFYLIPEMSHVDLT